MRIAIAGGHGKIGGRLIRILLTRGDEVRSLDRNPAYGDELRDAGAEPVVCDLETAEADEVERAIAGCDAVVFAAGAGPGSGPERKETMDYGGAVKLIAAAQGAGVRRYVIVSSIGADADAAGDETFAVYLRAKGRADAELERSGLDYTVIRPASLTDEPGAGTVRLGEGIEREPISRDDVAAVVAGALAEPGTIGKRFEAAGGDTPIDAALATV